MRLGLLRRPEHVRTVRLVDHQVDELPAAPREWNGRPGSTFAMYGNDTLGNCGVAVIANLASCQAAAEGLSLVFSEQAVIDFYLTHTGGADVGVVQVEVLQRIMRDRAFPHGGAYVLEAWAEVDHRDLDQLRAAAAFFSGAILDVALPDDWQAGAAAGLWDVTGPANHDNGHATAIVGFDDSGVDLVTWGEVVHATWPWVAAYATEAHALLDRTRLAVDVLGGAGLREACRELAAETGAGG